MTAVDMGSPKAAVIILTVNQREKTVRCLSSLRSVKSPQFHILLWDNGSCDGTAKRVQEEFSEVFVHHHPDNLGVASGRNAAAKLAIELFNPTHLLFLDNDIVVTSDFLEPLLEPFQGGGRLAQTQGKLRFLHDKQRLNDGGGCRIQFWLGRTVPVGYKEIDRGQYDQPSKCIACGGAMLVRTDVFQQLGGFDRMFDPFGPEDLDFSLRLYKAGYYALYVPRSLVFHEVTQTFEGGQYTEKYARHKAWNWCVFMWRHAPFLQKVGFVCIGLPLTVLRVIIREGRKGNVGALRGLVQGMVDFVKS